LLLIFFTGNAGYYIFFAWQQHEIKEAMELQLLAAVPDSLLDLIVEGQSNSFRWEEVGKEFYQQGQMYDVVKSVAKGNNTLLYCINDKKEAQLLSQLSEAARQQSGKGEKQVHKIQVIDLYFQPAKPVIHTSPVLGNNYTPFNAAIIAFTKEVNAPPPRA
jgi:hypothetical protein